MWSPGAGRIQFSTGGAGRWEIDATGHLIPVDDDSYHIGGASNAIDNLYIDGDIVGFVESHTMCFWNPNGITATDDLIAWRAPYACTISKLWAFYHAGTEFDVNALNEGADICSADYTVDTPDQWEDCGADQNLTLAAGEEVHVSIVSVTGAIEQIGIQLDVVRIT